MSYLVFDFGLKHIGVAVAEPRATIAHGITTISAKDGEPRWQDLDRLFIDWTPKRAIVGLPLNMDDSESEMCSHARRFGERIGARYDVAVEYMDERLSTFEAKSNAEDRRKAASLHAEAAAVIARTWLEELAAGRRVP